MKISGWIMLIGGGLGTIISALMGSDWPMYAFIIVASSGVILTLYAGQRKSKADECRIE